MKDLKSLLKTNWPVKLIFASGFIGFIDAAYLSATRYLGGIPDCKIVSGCEDVLASSYATFLHLPVSTWGIIYYALILTLAALIQGNRPAKFIKLLIFCAVTGVVATLYFIYLQAFILNAWCIYCLASGVTSVLILLGSLKLKPLILKGGVLK